MLPLETDLNTLPMIPNIPEKVFPNDAKNTEGDPTWRLIIIIWLKEREKKYWHVVNILFELSSTDALYTHVWRFISYYYLYNSVNTGQDYGMTVDLSTRTYQRSVKH